MLLPYLLRLLCLLLILGLAYNVRAKETDRVFGGNTLLSHVSQPLLLLLVECWLANFQHVLNEAAEESEFELEQVFLLPIFDIFFCIILRLDASRKR